MRKHPIAAVFGFAALSMIAALLFAAEKREARVTEVIRDVRLLTPRVGSRPAVVNENVREGTAVRTGTNSRAELTFFDRTLARIGENTVFSFGARARTYDLGSGAILVSAPEGTGTVRIVSPAATAALSGFTAMFEEHKNDWSKFIVLHGNGRVSFKGVPGPPCRLHTGQMIIWPPHPVRCPQVLNIDLSKLLQGNLVKGFKYRLPELDLILAAINNQQTAPPRSGLIDPTNVNALDLNANARPTPQTPPPRTPPPQTRGRNGL
jgi:FecR protein